VDRSIAGVRGRSARNCVKTLIQRAAERHGVSDDSASHGRSPTDGALTRRTLLSAVGAGVGGAVVGRLGTAGTAAAASLDADHPLDVSPGSAFAPHDGFATISWFDDDVEVVKVTNLDNSGEGSLREAAGSSGPRLVVFEVGGRIDLHSDRLHVADKVWVSGQTASSPGITLTNAYLRISGSYSVVQHIRVRPGDAIFEPTDALATGERGKNVIFDHCSASWTKYYGMWADGTTVTLSNNLVAETLAESGSSFGDHSRCATVRADTNNVCLLYQPSASEAPFSCALY
jgi:hypothetical protein